MSAPRPPEDPLRIDLHAHSTASDGTTSPGDLVRSARRAGLDVLALTDHDTVAGLAAATAALPAGLTLVPGAEVSCRPADPAAAGDLHLLAYLFDPADRALSGELDRLRGDRDRRARVMVERARALGAGLTWERVRRIAGDGAVGRPHLAAALVESGAAADAGAAFGPDWFGVGGRAYEPKHALDAAAAVRLVVAAGGVPVLAHPAAVRAPAPVPPAEIRRLVEAGLAGLEADTPEQGPAERARVRALADELGLLVTGGSDYHGERKPNRLGAGTTAPAALDRIVAAASGAVPVAA